MDKVKKADLIGVEGRIVGYNWPLADTLGMRGRWGEVVSVETAGGVVCAVNVLDKHDGAMRLIQAEWVHTLMPVAYNAEPQEQS